jgi:hypothetical protein
MKLMTRAGFALITMGLATAACADVFPKESLIKVNKDRAAGGQGVW